MLLPFGIYTTIVGLTAVLVTLLVVIAICEVLKRFLTREVKAAAAWRDEALRLAAAVSAIYSILDRDTPTPKVISSETSSWPMSAKLDSLRTFQEE